MATASISDGATTGQESQRRTGARPFLASLACLGASFANFLRYHDYPLLKPEVALVAVGLAVLAAVFALLHRLSPRIGKALLEGLLVYLAVDLNADIPTLAAGLGGLAFLLRLATSLSLLVPLTIVSAVVLLSAALGLSEHREPIKVTTAEVPPSTRQDSVLHILLDEHGGSGGAEPALRQMMVDAYVGDGFRLFDRGYSRHFRTVNSVPEALNFGSRGSSRKVDESLDVGRTQLLTLLEKRGYRLNIYQSDFADFCRYQSESNCVSYWTPSLAFVADKDLAATDKARLMAYKFVHLSNFLTAATDGWRYFVLRVGLTKNPRSVPSIEMAARSGTLGGLAILDRMAADMAGARPGDAYFAHILAPHYPYVVDADCNALPPTQWGYRRSLHQMAARRAAYGAQTSCVTKKVHAIVAAYLASPAGKNSTIIIHGDHGSRITAVDPAERNRGKISAEDYMAGYSTILAVRANGIDAGIDSRPTAVPDLLRTLTDNQFKSLAGLPKGNEQVHLDAPDWTVGTAVSLAGAWPDQPTTAR